MASEHIRRVLARLDITPPSPFPTRATWEPYSTLAMSCNLLTVTRGTLRQGGILVMNTLVEETTLDFHRRTLLHMQAAVGDL